MTGRIHPPLTPSFLIVAARAAAAQTPAAICRDAESAGKLRWDAERSLEFLATTGHLSHCRISVPVSSCASSS